MFENVGSRDPLYLFGTRWAAFVEHETAQCSVPASLVDGVLEVLVCDDAERALRTRARMLELPEVLVEVEEPLRAAVRSIDVRRVPGADVRGVQRSWAALRAERERA